MTHNRLDIEDAKRTFVLARSDICCRAEVPKVSSFAGLSEDLAATVRLSRLDCASHCCRPAVQEFESPCNEHRGGEDKRCRFNLRRVEAAATTIDLTPKAADFDNARTVGAIGVSST